jgi:hypothetical protein
VVRVITDRPPDDVVRLVVRGYVGSTAVVAPASLALGVGAPGAWVERTATVRTPPRVGYADVEVSFVGLDGDFEVTEPAERGAHGCDVTLLFAAPFAAGRFSGRVDIHVGREGTWRIPVWGEVAAPRDRPPREPP